MFYSFCLHEVVSEDHRVREIAAVLDLSWVHAEIAPWQERGQTPPRFLRGGVAAS
jgi:hypothetical protein